VNRESGRISISIFAAASGLRFIEVSHENHRMLCLSVLSLIVTSWANATISDADAVQFMAKYNCQACHQTDEQLVGPAFRDIAKKYKADAQ
jgi:cytochrome c551/c552